jgi:hypothetical protein
MGEMGGGGSGRVHGDFRVWERDDDIPGTKGQRHFGSSLPMPTIVYLYVADGAHGERRRKVFADKLPHGLAPKSSGCRLVSNYNI